MPTPTANRRRDRKYITTILLLTILALAAVLAVTAYGIWLAVGVPGKCKLGANSCEDCFQVIVGVCQGVIGRCWAGGNPVPQSGDEEKVWRDVAGAVALIHLLFLLTFSVGPCSTKGSMLSTTVCAPTRVTPLMCSTRQACVHMGCS